MKTTMNESPTTARTEVTVDMDPMQEFTDLIKANPKHFVEVTTEFERRYRADSADAGIRRGYFALQRELSARYPIRQYQPAEVEPPEQAWEDEAHPFWTSDPFTVWETKYRALEQELGSWTAARIHVFNNKGIPDTES